MDADKLIKTAIYTTWAADTIASECSGGLYLGKAGDDAARPYCVYNVLAHNRDWNWSKDEEEFVVQFSLFADDQTEVVDLKDTLTSCFDWATPSVSGHEHDRGFVPETCIGTEAEDYFMESIQYRVKIRKAR